MSAPSHLAPGSAAEAEKSANPAKLRSCVVCRSRKVRCDKLSPYSNCRRANIPCVVPSNDRPPRWARRLERVANNAAVESSPPDQAVMESRSLLWMSKEDYFAACKSVGIDASMYER
ncbi:hypothetical protein EDB80DRAFT_739926 [Ilyonectria destructans]|nr:hypothetical protein EDB80DRAFT_739926 [Ilyonectria destructans]